MSLPASDYLLGEGICRALRSIAADSHRPAQRHRRHDSWASRSLRAARSFAVGPHRLARRGAGGGSAARARGARQSDHRAARLDGWPARRDENAAAGARLPAADHDRHAEPEQKRGAGVAFRRDRALWVRRRRRPRLEPLAEQSARAADGGPRGRSQFATARADGNSPAGGSLRRAAPRGGRGVGRPLSSAIGVWGAGSPC